jgi:hypothetical protein
MALTAEFMLRAHDGPVRAQLSASVAPLALVLLVAACGGSPARARTVSVDETQIISGASPPPTDAIDCGSIQGPTFSAEAFQISATSDGHAIVTDAGGCELPVAESERVYSATNADCVLGPNSALKAIGVNSRRYALFRIDLPAGRFAANWVTLRDTTNGPSRECGVAEGPIVGVQ